MSWWCDRSGTRQAGDEPYLAQRSGDRDVNKIPQNPDLGQTELPFPNFPPVSDGAEVAVDCPACLRPTINLVCEWCGRFLTSWGSR